MSRDRRSELVVVAAKAAEYVGIRDVLQDWSALGLIEQVTLVNIDSLASDDVRIPCMVLSRGDARPALLQDELAARERTALARVVALSQIATAVSGLSDQEALGLVAQVSAALPTVNVARIHLVGMTTPRDGVVPALDELAWLGWHNVVVAPENAQSPTSGVSPIVMDEASPLSTLQLAGCLSSLTGLWSRQPSAALDDIPVAPGHSLVAARSFTRHLSAEAVESELIGRLADVTGGYPVPRVDGTSAEVIDDEVGAVTSMAQALERKHQYVFAGARAEPQLAPRKNIRAGELLKMFFSFLWHALRNAPRAFVDRVVYDVSRGTAAAVNRAVFGSSDPAFKVVVNGIGPDGKPASWEDFDAALAQLDARAEGGRDVIQHAAADLSPLWRDFLSAGMTLLDAGTRSAELAPQMKGSKRAVIVDPARVAPDPTIEFEISGEVAPYINRSAVAPHDIVAARDVYQQLDEVPERAPHLIGNAAKAKQALQAFFYERERTFTGRFGYRIFQDLDRCRKELAQYDGEIRRLQSATEANEAIYEQQRRLARRLKVILVVALAVLLAATLLTVLGVIGLVVMGIVAVVVLLGWLVTSVTAFVRGQTTLFALLHQRQQSADHEAILRQNTAAARDDLRRLGRAYRQYLDWARAFGTFVQAPLGRPAALAGWDLLLGTGFPRNHRFGSAKPEESVVEQSAARLRGELFNVGWMNEAWGRFLGDLPDIGSDGYRLGENRDLLFSDPQISRDSLLTRWSTAVAQRHWSGGPQALRKDVETALHTTARELMPMLLANVETRSQNGEVTRTGLSEFFSGLDELGSDTGHMFVRSMFSATTESAEPWRVAQTIQDSSAQDFSQMIVVTQLSRGFSPRDLSRTSALDGRAIGREATPTGPDSRVEPPPPSERPFM